MGCYINYEILYFGIGRTQIAQQRYRPRAGPQKMSEKFGALGGAATSPSRFGGASAC
jgi:hypothetical protein